MLQIFIPETVYKRKFIPPMQQTETGEPEKARASTQFETIPPSRVILDEELCTVIESILAPETMQTKVLDYSPGGHSRYLPAPLSWYALLSYNASDIEFKVAIYSHSVCNNRFRHRDDM